MRPIDRSLSILALLTACNAPPSKPTVTLSPAEPTTADDLVVTVDSEDPEGTEISFAYEWYVDGTRRTDLDGPVLSSDNTVKGQAVELEVVATDGELESRSDRVSVRIGNSLPSGEVTISPEAPLSGESLVATATGTDPDGDDVTFSYRWNRVGGDPGASVSGDTLSGEIPRKGQRWRVEATPSDGDDTGPAASAEVSIANAPPIIRGIELRPSVPTVADDVIAIIDAFDPDDANLTLTYRWTLNGQPISSTVVVDRSELERGASLALSVTASDGEYTTEPFRLDPVVVANALPTVGTVTLTPDSGVDVTGSVVCAASQLADADSGDVVTVSYAWTVNGTDAGVDGDTIDGSSFERGDAVVCVATPTDGADDGPSSASAPITIANSPPVVEAAEVSAADASSPISLVNVVTQDADGDLVELDHAWFVDGSVVSTDPTIAAGTFERGVSIYAVVTPTDGRSTGQPFTTARATVGNEIPVLNSVAYEPATPTVETDVTAIPDTSDADGDEVTVVWTWFVDDGTTERVVESITGPILPGTAYLRGDRVRAEGVPTDTLSQGRRYVAPNDVLIANAPPQVAAARFEPSTFSRDTSEVSCVAEGWSDSDGDDPSYIYQWTIGGIDAGGGRTRPGTAFAKGEAVSCSITPDDGTDLGVPVDSGDETVENARPTINGVSLAPDVSGPELTGASFRRNQAIRVIATPTDGTSEGLPAASLVDAIAVNSKPTVLTAVIGPANADTSMPITIAVTTSDADNDNLTYDVSWKINTAPYTAVRGLTLPAAATQKGDRISASVVALDGVAQSDPVPTDTLEIVNGVPTQHTITVLPLRSSAGSQPLRCVLVKDATDPDPLDQPSLRRTVTWTRNDVAYGSSELYPPQTTTFSGDTIPADAVQPGDRWTCDFEISDGRAAVTATSTSTAWGGELLSLSSGAGYTCGIGANDFPICWGLDDVGQSTPPFGVAFTMIDAGVRGTCGLTLSGTLRCWGTPTLSQGVPSGAYRNVQVGDAHACAINAGGTIVCWGSNSDGQRNLPNGSYRGLYVGPLHTCALGATNEAVCAGFGFQGQTAAPPGVAFSDLALGTTFTCGLELDGRIRCWGDALDSVPTGPTSYVDLQAGTEHLCATTAEGHTDCWPRVGSIAQVVPPVADIVASAPGAATSPFSDDPNSTRGGPHTCGIDSAGEVVCWGDGSRMQLQPPTSAYDPVAIGWAHMCGLDGDALTCWGNTADNRIQVPAGLSVMEVDTGRAHTCVILDDGALECWGLNTSGQTRHPDTGSYVALALGDEYGCAIDDNDDIACWGGAGSPATLPPAGKTWLDVGAGRSWTCGIDTDEAVTCWGDITKVDLSAPNILADEVGVGELHACALETDGGLTCWGDNTDMRATAPIGNVYTALSVGTKHSCALTNGKSIQCWGNDLDGRATPPATGSYEALFAGRDHTCALRTDGQLVCWGRYRL